MFRWRRPHDHDMLAVSSMKITFPAWSPCSWLLLILAVACQSPRLDPTRPAAPATPAVATSTSTPAPTPVPSPTQSVDQLIHPYTIDGLRHHHFQSGDVALLSTLETTDIYTRYLISYPSDGLTITGILQIPAEGHPPFPVIVMNHGYFNRS